MLHKPFMTIGETRIFGNGHDIPLLYWHELTEMEQKEFDWLESPDDNFLGFRYKGNVYCLSNIMRVEKHSPLFPYFDGHEEDSFFSGILVKRSTNDEFVKVYTYIS